MTTRIQKKYDVDLLKQVAERDSITVDYNSLGKINSLVYIDFICKCGKPGNKTFRLMFEKGSLCRDCTIELYNIRHKESLKKSTGFEYALQSKSILQKKKDTCMKRFNVEHATQSDVIKEKIKQTCLEKYNKPFASQVEEVRNKIKQTWFNNYGVYNPLQCPSIKDKAKETCLRKYGTSVPSKLKSIQEKGKSTCLKRYGVSSAMQLQSFKDKRINTCLQKYGVSSVFKLQSVKDKRVNTSLKRYGVSSAMKLQSFKDKRNATCLEKYGETSVMKVQFIKDKIKNTCLVKYGVPYASQAGLPSKGFEFKLYIYPDQSFVYVQGYEPFALDELVQQGYTSNDILTCRADVPSIWYIGKDGKRHRYFVDIYIPKINKMIEVKSLYTYNRYLESVQLKAKECIKQGYLYEIWIYNYKKEKTVIDTFI